LLPLPAEGVGSSFELQFIIVIIKHGFILYLKEQSLIAGHCAPCGISLISQQQRYPVFGLQAKTSRKYYLYIIVIKSK